MSAVDTRACPFCAETIKAAAIFCRFCGRELSLPMTLAAPLPAFPPAPPATPADAPHLRGSEIVELLTALVQKSLVVYEEDEQGQGRYRLLETVRQYGRDRLLAGTHEVGGGEAEVVQERYRAWFLALAEQAEPELEGAHQQVWLERLEVEHDNMRAALAWGLERKPQDALRLAVALVRFWDTRCCRLEGLDALEQALQRVAAAGDSGAAAIEPRVSALLWAGRFAGHRFGELGRARAFFEEALTLSRAQGDRAGVAQALNGLGSMLWAQGDYERGQAQLQEALALQRQLGDRSAIAWLLNNLGRQETYLGNYVEAQPLLEECLALHRQARNKHAQAIALVNLGFLAIQQGDYDAAMRFAEEGVVLYQQVGDVGGVALWHLHLGRIAEARGNGVGARDLYRKSLAVFWELRERWYLAECLEALAGAAREHAQSETAARLFGAAQTLRETIGAPLPPALRGSYHRHVAATRVTLGEESIAAAWAEGRAMSLEDAVKCALEDEGPS